MKTYKYIKHNSSGDVYAAEFHNQKPEAEPVAILGPIYHGDIKIAADAFAIHDLYNHALASDDAKWIAGNWHDYAS